MSSTPLPSRSRRTAVAATAGLMLLGLAIAYAPSFRGVFVLDDHYSIVQNPTIRELARLDRILQPGAGAGTVAGRPIASLTFALNYAAHGLAPWGYHALNLLIHAAAALTLFGLMRRSLMCVKGHPALAEQALPLAAGVAALWALHPLQTESVTYIVQRVESLAGLFYLLTLYGFIRGAQSPRGGRWFVVSVGACALGMGTKEVMATAPLLVLLYDRVLLAGSWSEVWAARGRVHLGLMSTWLLLAGLVLGAEGRGGSAGFSTAIGVLPYFLTQCHAVVHYLRLAVWPHPLVFDYGSLLIRDPLEVLLPGALLVTLALGTVWLWLRQSSLALIGAAFFLILAPSSSVVPVATQTMAEHRMYLPLAAVVIGVVLGLQRLMGRRMWAVILPLLIVLLGLTYRRNLVYTSELALWEDTVAHGPPHARAHGNLALALLEAGERDRAIAQLETALQLEPRDAKLHLNLAAALAAAGRPERALPHARTAVELDPHSASAQINLANALSRQGQSAEAIRHYREALRLEPDAADAHLSLAAVLLERGDAQSAIEHATEGLRLDPTRVDAWLDLARAQLRRQDVAAAETAALRALQLRPESADAHYVLGLAAIAREDLPSALDQFRRAVDLAPGFIAARNNLANALLLSGRPAEAIRHYELILAAQPGDRAVLENLAQAREWLLRTTTERATTDGP